MAKIGNFEIVGEIGRGAMGVVFRGFDPAIGRDVAIKVIRNQAFATNEEIQEARLRFAREAAAAGRLSHPNIVTVYHFGEEPGYQYLVMEFVEGKGLESAAYPECLAILRQIAGALDYAHAQGVIHRDVKPSNILVRPDGQAKLTDFGVARISSQTITHTGITIGTPSYMAPEQVMASRVDGKADQFSLAVVAFEMLTGRKPFEGPTSQAVLFSIVQGDRPAAHEINRALPSSVSAVLRLAMAKQPSDRFATCLEFVEALETALSPKVAQQPVPKQAPSPGAPKQPSSSITPPQPLTVVRARPRFLLVAAASAALGAALLAGAFALIHSRSSTPTDGRRDVAVTSPPTEPPPPAESSTRASSPEVPAASSLSVAPPVTAAPAVLANAGKVTFERLVNSALEPKNWLTYSGDYQGHHYSALTTINAGNVSRLKLIWKYEVTKLSAFEATPLVVDGVMYLSAPSQGQDQGACGVVALDARTGAPLWTYKCASSVASNRDSCCGWLFAMAKVVPVYYVNRGLAALDNKILVGTKDARLMALDAKTGKLIWDTLVPVWEDRAGYSIEGAPLVVKDKVIVGISNRRAGTRSFLAAFDVTTGQLAWKLFTIPAPGEPGHETWLGDSWRNGLAWTSGTGSYDPELNLLFWGTGGPSLQLDAGDSHLGDNLYSSSLLAINADTGKLRWYFQFTPHDVHGWGSNQLPVLFDDDVGGGRRRLVAMANPNGFYYVLEASTGKFLRGSPYVNLTWAAGLDSTGRPILAPTDDVPLPAPDFGTGWTYPSFNPQTSLLYISPRHLTTDRARTPVEQIGSVRAINAKSGALAWENIVGSGRMISSGLLSTAGGLVFGGTDAGRVFALDTRTGKTLWTFSGEVEIRANPISYAVQNKQYVAFSDRNSILVFGVE